MKIVDIITEADKKPALSQIVASAKDYDDSQDL